MSEIVLAISVCAGHAAESTPQISPPDESSRRPSIQASNLLFDSGIITRQTPDHSVVLNVEVKGLERLFLVALDGGDGIACDFANWAEPRFIKPGGEIRLIDLEWERVAVQYGEVNRNRNAEGGPLAINGQRVSHGIGTHANSVLVYEVPPEAARFQARAGLDSQGTEEGCGSTVQFLVYANDLPTEMWPPKTPEKAGPAAPSRIARAEDLKLAEGFQAELIYEVPAEFGSWVCLASDPQGRLIASDEHGQLYRITLAKKTERLQVEPLSLELQGAQGLLYAFDSLYVMVNGRDRSGLYRARDTNGDDQFDEVQLLQSIKGHGEHGPHAIIPGPEGKWLYVVAGNATELPAFNKSWVPQCWQPDELLPRLGQTDGFWRPESPGGWIARIDPLGKAFELFAIGFRNPYDIAFNADGELFTFDADMEWDMGVPWYRPTRINHVTRGGEFGWRTGSSKWPDYYLDSLPSVLDVGASSPTGLTFGYGAKFPAQYQRAFFLGDWSFGKIYVLHLQPDGATYRGALETFCSGSPLPITDLIIHPLDGSLYFVVGGRNTTSALYRIAYAGTGSTAPAESRDVKAIAARKLRQELETLHSPTDPQAIDQAWPHLGHADRYVRYAARTAIEHQPVTRWQERALKEKNLPRFIAAMTALARVGNASMQAEMIQAVNQIEWHQLSKADQVDLLRIYTLVLVRMGKPSPVIRDRILARLERRFPAESFKLNRELSQLMVYLEAPGVIDRTLSLMKSAASQEEQIWYLLVLRNLDREHWNTDQLAAVFGWFQASAAKRGGVTFNDYLRGIRYRMEKKLSETDRQTLAEVLKMPEPEDPYAALRGRAFVRNWTLEDLLPNLPTDWNDRDWENGRKMYSAVMCVQCHRFNGEGGMTGPDLTGVGNRFDDRSLLESILEPSKVISDQFNTVIVATSEGEHYIGRIGDINQQEILLMTDLINPAAVEKIPHSIIESISPSSVSMMPEGLLVFFTREEILDLMAYLKRGKE